MNNKSFLEQEEESFIDQMRKDQFKINNILFGIENKINKQGMNITQEQPLEVNDSTSFNTLTNYVHNNFSTLPYIEPVVNYWNGYYNYSITEDRVTKSFKIIQHLIEKKKIKEPKTIKEFIELVNEISTLL